MADQPQAEWKIGELKLRYELVWSMAISSLKMRLGRTFLTVLTITTSTAFLMYLMTQPRGTDQADRENWYLMMGLSLLVSAAGVLNTMLMNVAQRYREIGTIKCLGALDSFVLYSVLVESAILGFVGAVAGVLIGSIISLLLGWAEFGSAVFQNLDFNLATLPLKVLAAFAVGMLLTTLGAAAPAYIASKMPPMDAMRGEK